MSNSVWGLVQLVTHKGLIPTLLLSPDAVLKVQTLSE